MVCLYSHNLIFCNSKGCDSTEPLLIKVARSQIVSRPLNKKAIETLMQKIDWESFRETALQVPSHFLLSR